MLSMAEPEAICVAFGNSAGLFLLIEVIGCSYHIGRREREASGVPGT